MLVRIIGWMLQIFGVAMGFLFHVGAPYGLPVIVIITCAIVIHWIWKIADDRGKEEKKNSRGK